MVMIIALYHFHEPDEVASFFPLSIVLVTLERGHVHAAGRVGVQFQKGHAEDGNCVVHQSWPRLKKKIQKNRDSAGHCFRLHSLKFGPIVS
jgi:hypothetical protein